MFDFVDKSRVPDLVESLTDVEEYSTAVLFVFERFVYGLYNSVNLLHGGVFLAKPKLVVRYPVFWRQICVYSAK